MIRLRQGPEVKIISLVDPDTVKIHCQYGTIRDARIGDLRADNLTELEQELFRVTLEKRRSEQNQFSHPRPFPPTSPKLTRIQVELNEVELAQFNVLIEAAPTGRCPGLITKLIKALPKEENPIATQVASADEITYPAACDGTPMT